MSNGIPPYSNQGGPPPSPEEKKTKVDPELRKKIEAILDEHTFIDPAEIARKGASHLSFLDLIDPDEFENSLKK